MAVILERTQVAHGTAAQFTSLNPMLLAGEIGYETDTGKVKFGDGTTAWASLGYSIYAPLASPAFTGNPTAPTQTLGNSSTRLATTAFVAQGFAPAIATGVATLVGGTVTVANANATANSIIRVMHKTPGGTLGALFCSARTAATNFTLKSTSATDTSVVYWEVVAW